MKTPKPTRSAPSERELSPIKRALAQIRKLQARVRELEQAAQEPVAVVSMACRLPGGADTPERFWEVLANGTDCASDVPDGRWDLSRLVTEARDQPEPGRITTRAAHFVDGIDQFDPSFFRISPREAEYMDPQQRLLLEVAWEALERAGLTPAQASERPAGVFLGLVSSSYATLTSSDLQKLNPHSDTGGLTSVAAGRLAYALDLHGPTMVVDTACSSSLVALHLSLRSLRSRECDMALVGGADLMCTPHPLALVSQVQALSPDGRCRSFDASAGGYGRGEGVGLIVLKRLSDAIADGDPVLALLRGSAINHDGATSGLTVPSGQAQEQVIRQALADASLSPEDINCIEAHGTGTPLGDPIELEALAEVFGGRERPLWLASVKTNIGHLEGAAGIAGVIKAVLSLQHRQVPAHLHFETPTPEVDWRSLPFEVPRALEPWTAERRRVGVSSFGFSGTNAHVVLEEAPAAQGHDTEETSPTGPSLLCLSARTEPALQALVARYVSALASEGAPKFKDLCFTANTGHAHFKHRLCVRARSTATLRASLEGASGADSSLAQGAAARPPNVVFLYTGQGAQHPGMGRALYAQHPVYRDAIDRCAALLDGVLERPLRAILNADANTLKQTAFTQPALFALEYALTELWRSWGVMPDAVMGHSLGEVVAATVAGVFSLDDALRLVAARGRLMQALPGGSMAAVRAPEALVRAAIAGVTVDIAAVNGPSHVVLSGAEDALTEALETLSARGVPVRRLEVSHAFHSSLMEPMQSELRRVAESIAYRPPALALVSNLSGALAGTEMSSADYWVRQAREPVRFAQGMKTLEEMGHRVFVEVGPRPVLLGMGSACVEADDCAWLPSLRPERELPQLMDAVAGLYVRGAELRWGALSPPERVGSSCPPTPSSGRPSGCATPRTRRGPRAPRRPAKQRPPTLCDGRPSPTSPPRRKPPRSAGCSSPTTGGWGPRSRSSSATSARQRSSSRPHQRRARRPRCCETRSPAPRRRRAGSCTSGLLTSSRRRL